MNAVPLADRCASRHHAKVELLQDHNYYFVDLNSRNGSLVNGQPTTAPVLLKHGDRIQIGKTELIFQYSPNTPVHSASKPSEDVLMLQASATQGKIWKDLLHSQNIAVRWELPGTDLKSYIALKASAHVLPRLLLLDMQAFRGDSYGFCRWCQQEYPQLKIILMNSGLGEISGSEYQKAIQQGSICLLPAFPEPNLLDHVASIVAQVNLVLQALDNRSLHQDKLFLALQSLEGAIKQQSPLEPSVALNTPSKQAHYPESPDPWEDDWDSQDLTSLEPHRQGKFSVSPGKR